MDEAGTLQDVRAFTALLKDVRKLAGRRVMFLLIHPRGPERQSLRRLGRLRRHLLHVQGQGHGRTRLYVQKARWASSRHATSLHLIWTDGEGFALEDKPEVDDETLAEQILAAVTDRPA
jgi:hypothetical protein